MVGIHLLHHKNIVLKTEFRSYFEWRRILLKTGTLHTLPEKNVLISARVLGMRTAALTAFEPATFNAIRVILCITQLATVLLKFFILNTAVVILLLDQYGI